MKLSDVKIVQKNLDTEQINRHDLGSHWRCNDSITIKEVYNFVRVGEQGIELMVLTYFCFNL